MCLSHLRRDPSLQTKIRLNSGKMGGVQRAIVRAMARTILMLPMVTGHFLGRNGSFCCGSDAGLGRRVWRRETGDEGVTRRINCK